MVSDVIPSSEGYATVGSCLRAGGEVKYLVAVRVGV